MLDLSPCRHVVLGHLHMQRWRTVRSRRTGELVRVQRADTRAVREHAEACTPARGDHVNSDVVQSSAAHLKRLPDEACAPQLCAAGQTTDVGHGICDVLGVRQRVQGAHARC